MTIEHVVTGTFLTALNVGKIGARGVATVAAHGGPQRRAALASDRMPATARNDPEMTRATPLPTGRQPARSAEPLPPVTTIPMPHPDGAARVRAQGLTLREFAKNRDGMIHAMDGGLWLHFHRWRGREMAHLVSANRKALLAYAEAVGFPVGRLQYKPLKDPRTGERCDAWHWDLGGAFLPERAERSFDSGAARRRSG
jgi:hypothetical protein